MNYLINRLNEEFDKQIPLWVVNSIENIPEEWEKILIRDPKNLEAKRLIQLAKEAGITDRIRRFYFTGKAR